MQAGRDRVFFWGGYSPNPCTHPGTDPAAGEGLCLLSIAGRLSVLFVHSGWDRVCFWGMSASAAAKLLGRYCDRALLDVLAPLNLPCLAFIAEIRPAAPVPSSPPVLVLSEAPQPLSAEALGPALQQLDLATPTTLQVRTMGCNCPSASVSPPARA